MEVSRETNFGVTRTMTARKRKPHESFKEYRENLKAEERAFKQRYRGYIAWQSAEHGTFYRNKDRQQSRIIRKSSP